MWGGPTAPGLAAKMVGTGRFGGGRDLRKVAGHGLEEAWGRTILPTGWAEVELAGGLGHCGRSDIVRSFRFRSPTAGPDEVGRR
jgi:hypothetical protein